MHLTLLRSSYINSPTCLNIRIISFDDDQDMEINCKIGVENRGLKSIVHGSGVWINKGAFWVLDLNGWTPRFGFCSDGQILNLEIYTVWTLKVEPWTLKVESWTFNLELNFGFCWTSRASGKKVHVGMMWTCRSASVPGVGLLVVI